MAISGVGTVFHRWNTSTGAWDAIAEINSIGGPSMSRDTIETTSLDTVGGYKTFIASFRDPGNVQLSMNFTRAGYDLMKTDFESSAAQNYEIVLPDADNTSFEFEGLVVELPLNIVPDDKVGMDVNIKVSGQVTVNSGSGS